MTAIFVEDADTSIGIGGATFDHSSTNAGGGFYDVQLDLQNNDFTFTTSAPGYNTQMWNFAIQGGVVPMTPSGGGNGDGTCF